MRGDSIKRKLNASSEEDHDDNSSDRPSSSKAKDKLLHGSQSSPLLKRQGAETSVKMDQSGEGSSAKNPETLGLDKSESGNDAEDNAASASSLANGDRSPGTQRVKFDAGTKERDGSLVGVKRIKRSFRDIVLKEVMAKDLEDSSSPILEAPQKGILKVRSEPSLSSKNSGKQSLSFVNKAYEGDLEGDKGDATTTSNSGAVATTKKSGFPFPQEGFSSTGQSGFADVVGFLIQRSSIDLGGRDMHPFGRDCSIEGIMQASRPKSHSKNSAFGKLVIWMTLMSILLGAACGVIFLSETYNAKQRESRLLQTSLANVSST